MFSYRFVLPFTPLWSINLIQNNHKFDISGQNMIFIATFAVIIKGSVLLLSVLPINSHAKKTKNCKLGEYYSKSTFKTTSPGCASCPSTFQRCSHQKLADRKSCEKDCAKFYHSNPKSTKTTRLSTPINTTFYFSKPVSTKTTRRSINTTFYPSKPKSTKTTRFSINKLYTITTRKPSKGIFRNPTDLSSTEATSSNTAHVDNQARDVVVGNTFLTWLLLGLAIFLFASIFVCCRSYQYLQKTWNMNLAYLFAPVISLQTGNNSMLTSAPNSKPNEPKPTVAGGVASATTDALGPEPIGPFPGLPKQETSYCPGS